MPEQIRDPRVRFSDRVDDYLKYLGLRADVSWRPALGSDGQPVPDLRAYPYELDDGSGPRLALSRLVAA